uniref:Uncharacterized protein n=1 Tax=Romanomermis culicivorax TaxID=13658 RepID=A0A915HE66_ROMCU
MPPLDPKNADKTCKNCGEDLLDLSSKDSSEGSKKRTVECLSATAKIFLAAFTVVMVFVATIVQIYLIHSKRMEKQRRALLSPIEEPEP